ncbi:MAG: carbonic anhydrase family protein [Prochloraceae cyanobacterium]|nr:carbonic anhydrase family protein [Prochloraceae cyanobacterium]
MQRRTLLKYVSMATAGAAFSFSFPSLKAAIASEDKTGHGEWNYDTNGPSMWGEIAPDFKVCEMGTQQSPINLEYEGSLHTELHDLDFDYHLSALHIRNNGHTIQVNPDHQNHLRLAKDKFDLLQFHFHHPSEHVISNEHFPMEAHLVHRNSKGELAVLGIFIKEGRENQVLKTLWQELPEKQGPERLMTGHVNINQLLPVKKASYRYMGSLTTPPCSEIVRWIVFEEPIEASPEQLQKFAQIYPHNNRPVQPNNHRMIIEG